MVADEKKVEALAMELEIDREEAQELIDAGDYLVLTDEQADYETTAYIKEALWAFNADFILGECGLDLSGAESLKTMQEKSCEGANDFILSLVEKTCGLAEFVASAISADGRGHFLAHYDGEEVDLVIDGKTQLFAYRVN